MLRMEVSDGGLATSAHEMEISQASAEGSPNEKGAAPPLGLEGSTARPLSSPSLPPTMVQTLQCESPRKSGGSSDDERPYQSPQSTETASAGVDGENSPALLREQEQEEVSLVDEKCETFPRQQQESYLRLNLAQQKAIQIAYRDSTVFLGSTCTMFTNWRQFYDLLASSSPCKSLFKRECATNEGRRALEMEAEYLGACLDAHTYEALPKNHARLSDNARGSGDALKNDQQQQQQPSQISIGDKVKAKWKGNGKFYSARVTECNSDGTYDVRFDDGDEEPAVKADDIKKVNINRKKPTSSKGKDSTDSTSKDQGSNSKMNGKETTVKYQGNAMERNQLERLAKHIAINGLDKKAVAEWTCEGIRRRFATGKGVDFYYYSPEPEVGDMLMLDCPLPFFSLTLLLGHPLYICTLITQSLRFRSFPEVVRYLSAGIVPSQKKGPTKRKRSDSDASDSDSLSDAILPSAIYQNLFDVDQILSRPGIEIVPGVELGLGEDWLVCQNSHHLSSRTRPRAYITAPNGCQFNTIDEARVYFDKLKQQQEKKQLPNKNSAGGHEKKRKVQSKASPDKQGDVNTSNSASADSTANVSGPWTPEDSWSEAVEVADDVVASSSSGSEMDDNGQSPVSSDKRDDSNTSASAAATSPAMNSGPWTPEEMEKLKNGMEVMGDADMGKLFELVPTRGWPEVAAMVMTITGISTGETEKPKQRKCDEQQSGNDTTTQSDANNKSNNNNGDVSVSSGSGSEIDCKGQSQVSESMQGGEITTGIGTGEAEKPIPARTEITMKSSKYVDCVPLLEPNEECYAKWMERDKYYGQLHKAIIMGRSQLRGNLKYTVKFPCVGKTFKLGFEQVKPLRDYEQEIKMGLKDEKLRVIERDESGDGWKIKGRDEVFFSIYKALRTFDSIKVQEVSLEDDHRCSIILLFSIFLFSSQ